MLMSKREECILIYLDSLATESQPKGSKPNTHTVQFVNLAHARSVEVISESVEQSTVSLLPNLSFSKVS